MAYLLHAIMAISFIHENSKEEAKQNFCDFLNNSSDAVIILEPTGT